MSLIRCICNTETGVWDFAPFNLNHNFCDLEIVFTDSSTISKVTFGVEVLTDGTKRYSHSFGPEFAYTYAMQDDYYNSVRIDYPIASTILVNTWAKVGRKTYRGTYEFSRPLPPQPFPSWTLNNGAWSPPAPHPGDGNTYKWDEDALAWVRVEFNEDTQMWIEVR